MHTNLAQCLRQRGAAIVVHVLFEVHVEVFEDKVEFLISMNHVQEGDNIGMVQLLEQGNLTDGSAGDSFGFSAKKKKRIP